MLTIMAPGETNAEIEKILLGQMDTEMTTRGLDQVKDCADTLSVYQYDIILCSDDTVSSKSARILNDINKHDAPIVEVDVFRGRSCGTYEGMTYQELRTLLPPRKYREWERDIYEFPEFGESYMDMINRIVPFVRNEVEPRLNMNMSVLIVAPIEVVRILITMASGAPEMEIPKTRAEHGVPYFYYGKTLGKRS